MFEDIIGKSVGKKKDGVAKVVRTGDGVISCPYCGSANIDKGTPLFLISSGTQQLCECKSCARTWSLSYDPVVKKYTYRLHLKKP